MKDKQIAHSFLHKCFCIFLLPFIFSGKERYFHLRKIFFAIKKTPVRHKSFFKKSNRPQSHVLASLAASAFRICRLIHSITTATA